jgi:NADPH:quinone reductase-like Zn-dependent oxidoreductase
MHMSKRLLLGLGAAILIMESVVIQPAFAADKVSLFKVITAKDEIVIGLDDIDTPVDLVLDNVGGGHLVTAWNLLRPGGILQSIGWASDEPATFPLNSIFAPGAAKTLRSFGDASLPGPDLATLAGLAARGTITAQVEPALGPNPQVSGMILIEAGNIVVA